MNFQVIFVNSRPFFKEKKQFQDNTRTSTTSWICGYVDMFHNKANGRKFTVEPADIGYCLNMKLSNDIRNSMYTNGY